MSKASHTHGGTRNETLRGTEMNSSFEAVSVAEKAASILDVSAQRNDRKVLETKTLVGWGGNVFGGSQ
jgi:hypothetical protein